MEFCTVNIREPTAERRPVFIKYSEIGNSSHVPGARRLLSLNVFIQKMAAMDQVTLIFSEEIFIYIPRSRAIYQKY